MFGLIRPVSLHRFTFTRLLPITECMSEQTAQKKYKVLLLMMVSIAAGWLYSYAVQGPGIDREVFRYAGMTIANGETPYLAFFDHKPPLIYFIYWLAHPFGVYGAQIIFTLFTFLVSLLVYQCCRKWLGRFAILLTCLWIAMMHDPLVMADGGQNRQFSALVATALISYGFLYKERLNWLLVGLGAFLVFFTQLTDFPALLPFIAWLIFRQNEPEKKRRTIVKRIALLLSGFIIPAIILWLWFCSRDAQHAFLYDVFTFNSSWYVDADYFGSKTTYVAVMMLKTGYILPLCALIFLKRSRNRFPALLLFLCGTVQAAALIPGFFFNHYFIAVIPYSFFGWVLLFREAVLAGIPVKFRQLMYTGAILLVLFYLKPLHWFQKNTNTYEKQIVRKMEPFAREVQNKKGQLFGFDVAPGLSLNASYHIISPSRWLYFHFWLRPGWDTKLDTFRTEVLDQLDKYECTYVMDRDIGVTQWRPQLKQIWEEYINRKYELIFEDKSATGKRLFRLLKRKQNTAVE